MTKSSWGLKRHCMGCGSHYYDLGKNPAACPKCKLVQDINAPIKRRGRKQAAVEVDDDPLAKAKAKGDLRQKPKKPVKEIEDVNLDEFEEIEPIDSKEEIEELEDVEDIESIEEIEEIEEPSDDEMVLEDDTKALIDTVDEDEEVEAEEEDDSAKKSKRPAAAKKPIAKPAVKKK